MATTVVLGAQWGDEGKGKLVDILSADATLCARCQGGDNAGHTIVANGIVYDFHILPSGLMNAHCMNVIGSGVVVHVPTFFAELQALQQKGLDTTGRIVISDRAHVVFDLHRLVDGLEEVELGTANLGTTKKGIGPAYACKAARSGVRLAEVFDVDTFEGRLRRLAHGYRKRYGELLKAYDVEDEIKRFEGYRARLAEYVVDVVPLMASAQEKNARILVEGANALMLDLDYGTYPFVTSSSAGLGGVFTGLAISPFKVKEVIGVVKAYTTRVGSGPFPTELLNETGVRLQQIGHEIGVTTGRKRRCGWLDLVVVRYSTAINHYTALNVTKLDILDTFAEIKVATAYEYPSATNGADDDGGDATKVAEAGTFPASLAMLAQAKPIYRTFPGWLASTAGTRSYDDLPLQARRYLDFIESFVGVRVRYVGVGKARDDMITRR
ncbi:MAG: hypothetical protein M1826_003014 [Phylliscum demangeonii]|nr:MAG: hypothetical protein M1826_003014 [Phylliscum demangeonii]